MAFRPPISSLLRALGMLECAHAGVRKEGLDNETLEAILNAAGTVARDELRAAQPSWRFAGRAARPRTAAAPDGSAAAYGALADGGWTALAADAVHGGEAMPKALELAIYEMFHAANMALGLCPMLTVGAGEALAAHGTDWQRTKVLPRLVSGRWTGAMDLTEARADRSRASLRAPNAMR